METILAGLIHQQSGLPSALPSTPRSSPHGHKWLTAMLVEAAGSVGRMKGANYLSAQFARIASRRSMSRAAVAVADSILVAAYYMLLRDEPYTELRADWLAGATNSRTPAGWSPRCGECQSRACY